jgi:hypothetical protein
MLRRLGGWALAGASAYACADAASDAIIFLQCKQLILERAAHHTRFTSALGGPDDAVAVGPWFNSSVALADGGMFASATLPVTGTQRGSDVTIRVSCTLVDHAAAAVVPRERSCTACRRSRRLTARPRELLQLVRRGGFRWAPLFTLTGGQWEPLMVTAVVGSGPGGIPISMSLLELEAPVLQEGAACVPPQPARQPRGGGRGAPG